tara:strand:+ start:6076 stop:7218 length:1143 start_codon:yes stop_codon:yes gene_type:complete
MADSDNKPVDLTQTSWRPSDGVDGLLKQNNRKLIARKSTYKENQVVTAKVLTGALRLPTWYEKIGNFEFFQSDKFKHVKYKVRVEEDPRSYICPKPLSAKDNAVDLPQITCDIDESLGGTELVAGAKVQIRINNPSTCFTAEIGATIIKIINNSPDWTDSSENCEVPMPNSGSAKKSTVKKACAASRGSRGRPIKQTSIPKSTTGVSPRGPLTARPTTNTEALGHITSPFGSRNPPPGGSANHAGIDLRAGVGQKVYAVLDGELIAAAQSRNPETHGAGYYAVIKHTAYKADTPNSTFYTLYMHLTKDSVIAANKFGSGKTVKAGDQIALSGDSGAGPAHLHFGVVYDNDPSWQTGGQVSQFGTHADPETDFFPNLFVKK